ncbi:MAG: substrate-binding domain-containing protein [Actinobacteria bacterium]|nr:substrate-binding domain-containing protein [Actinomycetota bacterium]MCG2818378.1 substrate-binding domain-containing protein [Actinomycetes bacterium]MBU4178757.1 substrate-binding domain-containing protein [Actinomycetota bacterium]MBU4219997.1 substrate-binding domain-containing protein [Actinomycetota bacterium]MBU4358343.1 substrate-binding domain-containing protein [Actinomycetota bacterium]
MGKKLIVFTVMLMLAASLPALAGCGEKKEESKKSFVLATTTSTQDSGLLDLIIPDFEKKYGVTVKTIAVGTGEALKMGERGDADVLLVHAKDSEEKLVDDGYGLERVEIMYNDFIIVGPEADPAGIKGEKSAADALGKIAETGSTFVSRGDDSGTNKKEKTIWAEAGVDPAWQQWYVETGQGMGNTLTVAAEKQGYTLSDRATYLSKKETVDLVTVVEGDKALFNQYSAIVINPEKHPDLDLNVEGAGDFVEFLTSDEGQELIGSYEKYGTVLFHPNAIGETGGTGD